MCTNLEVQVVDGRIRAQRVEAHPKVRVVGLTRKVQRLQRVSASCASAHGDTFKMQG